jgi:hypothetical protein
MTREVHGLEFDPKRSLLDLEVITRIGEGKKHGRYFLSDSILHPADVSSLMTVKARSTSSASSLPTWAVCGRLPKVT